MSKDAKEPVKETVTEPTPANDYTPKHKGGGSYEVAGKLIKGKEKAEEYARDLRRADERLNAPDLSDVMPPGWNARARDRAIQFRNNLRELPMNETHMPDGSINPMYDRAYRYVWASYSDVQDVPDKQSRGYELVSREELEKMVNDGKCPEHYLNLLREEGSYLVYADDVLMRQPRVLYRQMIAERERLAMAHVRRQEEQGREQLANAGVPVVDSPIGSGFKSELLETEKGANEINF